MGVRWELRSRVAYLAVSNCIMVLKQLRWTGDAAWVDSQMPNDVVDEFSSFHGILNGGLGW